MNEIFWLAHFEEISYGCANILKFALTIK
mgnify:CR=1